MGKGVEAGTAVAEPTEETGGSRVRPSPAWVSAGAAALSAVVAAIALTLGAFGSDDETPAPSGASTVPTGPVAPDASPAAGGRRSIAIASMAFVADGPGAPAFEFRGTAELNDPDDEEVHVIARRLAGATDDGDTWLISPAADVDRDGSWLTRIAKPPLPDGSFDFAAVIAPTPAKTPSTNVGVKPQWSTSMAVRPSSVTRCGLRPALASSGVKSCLVLDATVVKTYEP